MTNLQDNPDELECDGGNDQGSVEPTGNLEPIGVVPDFLGDLFRDLDPTCKPTATQQSLRSESGDVRPEQRRDLSSLRRTWRLIPWSVSVIAVVVSIASGVRTFGLSRTLSATRSLYQSSAAELEAKKNAESLRSEIDKQVLEPTILERKEGLLARYISTANFVRVQKGHVNVIARNVKFPCFLEWTADGKSQTKKLTTGETTLNLPLGRPVTVFCRPFHTAGWLQTVQIWVKHDSEKLVRLGSVLGKTPLTLNNNDEVVIFFEEPVPPWNAVCVPIKNESILVTLERPRAEYDADKWLAGTWEGREEFPNTAMFWAREGSHGLATELAASFMAQRSEFKDQFDFRGSMHTSLLVQGDGMRPSVTMQQITQEELEAVLFIAFEQLRNSLSPNGDTIQDEIDRGAELLDLANIASSSALDSTGIPMALKASVMVTTSASGIKDFQLAVRRTALGGRT